MPAKVESKAVLDKLADRETEVKVHTLGDTLSEQKGMETLHTLKDTVAENEFESLGDTQFEVSAKALDYQMVARKEEVKVEKLGDTSQRREGCTGTQTGCQATRRGGRDTWRRKRQDVAEAQVGTLAEKRAEVQVETLSDTVAVLEAKKLLDTLRERRAEIQVETTH